MQSKMLVREMAAVMQAEMDALNVVPDEDGERLRREAGEAAMWEYLRALPPDVSSQVLLRSEYIGRVNIGEAFRALRGSVLAIMDKLEM